MKQCAPIFLQQRAESKKNLAERVGFEHTIPVKVYTLSKRAPSATRPSLRPLNSSLDFARDFACRLTLRSRLQIGSTSATRPSLRARKQLIHYSEWQAQAVAEDSVLFAPSFETWRCHVSTLRFLVVPGACG